MTREQFLSSFENVCELFESIKDTSSRLEKESLLSSYSDKEFLKQVLLYTYNPYYVYGVGSKSIETINFTYFTNYNHPIDNLFDLLEYLKINNTGKETDTDKANKYLQDIGNKFLENYAVKIILKDLKIGINIETINKCFPKLIPTFKVGLCKTYEDATSLRYDNYIVQPKLDGVRIIAICTGGSAELYTRNGMKVEGYDEVAKELSHECWKGFVLDGEILTDNFDGTMKGLFALKEDKKAVYHIFDILHEKEFNEQRSSRTYEERWHLYNNLINNYQFDYLMPVVGTLEKKETLIKDISILDSFARSAGYEGLILKGTDSTYEFKRSYAWTKYKSWHTEDFEVIGMEEGTGKYEGMLGALVVNANGVRVKVGSGFSDEQRDELWSSLLPDGLMAEVKFQEKTKDGSLRFPTFIKFRNDI